MNSEDKIKIALRSASQFFIIEGDQEKNLNYIEHFYDQENKALSLIDSSVLNAENSRIFVSELSKKSVAHEVYIIKDFHNIEIIPQNILLKSLETMVENKIVIALCDHTSGLLDTVVSRAYHLYAPAAETKKFDSVDDGFIFSGLNNTQRMNLFSKQFGEDNILIYDYSLGQSVFGEDHQKKLKINKYVLEYFKRIEANCNKDLSADLLIYKILEDK